MYLKLQNYKKHDMPINGKGAFSNLFITSVYHPWREKEHSRFNQVLDDFIRNVKDSAGMLMGTDINAKIDVRETTSNTKMCRDQTAAVHITKKESVYQVLILKDNSKLITPSSQTHHTLHIIAKDIRY